jgi:hypothetical protein
MDKIKNEKALKTMSKKLTFGYIMGHVVPMMIIVGVFATIFLSQMGYIMLPRIHLGNQQSKVYAIPDAVKGVPYSYDFSTEMIPLLKQSLNGSDPGIYTFYLGSGVGFPPMGLILGIDGVMSGTPTAEGERKFQVCVKDAGGTSVCRMYSLNVLPADQPSQPDQPNQPDVANCPAKSDPPCHSAVNGVGVTGVIVPGSCDCPSDTDFAQMDNITQGGPYKMCTCK